MKGIKGIKNYYRDGEDKNLRFFIPSIPYIPDRFSNAL
jgi:hypothetical protein